MKTLLTAIVMFCIIGVAHAKPNKFDVEASFKTKAAVETIWDVLTDYNTHNEFMSAVTSSLFRAEHFGKKNVLLQTIQVRLWFFKPQVDLQIEDIEEKAFHSIEFHGATVGRKPSLIENASWTIQENKTVTLKFTLTIRRGFIVPRPVVRRAVRNMVKNAVQEVKVEIDRRQEANNASTDFWRERLDGTD